MQYRKLGKSGLTVSEIGFGGWAIGGGWGNQNDNADINALKYAYDNGVNFFDTAYLYGGGKSEKIMGTALKNVRDKVIIATKIPCLERTPQGVPADDFTKAYPLEKIIQYTEESLERLGTDYIDLQQFHGWNDIYTDRDDWYEIMQQLKGQGKIRSFGISANSWDPDSAIGLVKSGKIDSVQVIYNIFDQQPADNLFPASIEGNIGIIARVPLFEGLLSEKIRHNHKFADGDWRKDWLTDKRLSEVMSRLEKLKLFLNSETPTLSSLALKFCISHPAVSTTIPGMRNLLHITQNCSVSNGRTLPKNTLAQLEQHRFIHKWNYPWFENFIDN